MMNWYAATCAAGSEATIARKAGSHAVVYVPTEPVAHPHVSRLVVLAPLLAEADEHGYVFFGVLGATDLRNLRRKAPGLIDWLRKEGRQVRVVEPDVISQLQDIQRERYHAFQMRQSWSALPGERVRVRRRRQSNKINRTTAEQRLHLKAIKMRIADSGRVDAEPIAELEAA